jgi:flagellar assembly protein FliH
MRSLSKNVRLSEDIFHLEDGESIGGGLSTLTSGDVKRLLKERQELGYEQGHKQGRSEGFSAGLIQGAEQGKQDLAGKLGGQVELTGRLLEESQQLKNSVIREAEPQVAALAMKIAEKIIQVEVENREIVLKLVKHAIEQTVDRQLVEVRVNPDDYDSVEKIRSEIMSSVKRIGELVIIKDTTVGRGGCFISTPSGNIDAQIDNQFKELRRTLNL